MISTACTSTCQVPVVESLGPIVGRGNMLYHYLMDWFTCKNVSQLRFCLSFNSQNSYLELIFVFVTHHLCFKVWSWYIEMCNSTTSISEQGLNWAMVLYVGPSNCMSYNIDLEYCLVNFWLVSHLYHSSSIIKLN